LTIQHKLLVIFLLISSFVNAQKKLNQQDLDVLKTYMVGSFNSALQAKNDSDFYEIHLHMAPIWENRKDGFWMYVEQAIVTDLNKPYRQRIYHVSLINDSTILSEVLEMKSPLRFAGAYKNIALLDKLTSDSLEARKGCGIFLHARNNGSFVGSTNKQDCLSTMRGATYATSEVIISKQMLVSWDRGWDTQSKQMWGAVKSGYQFVKQME
jgi:CpeT protein